MLARIRVPHLCDDNIVIRTTNDPGEIQKANQLVFKNYVEQGYWQNDESILERNSYLNLPTRCPFVITSGPHILGTVSIIKDSKNGLPADSFQAEAVAGLRKTGDSLAEISALAIDKSVSHQRTLILFLITYIFQYSFHYAGIDRFVVVCTPKHAGFYTSTLGFTKVEATSVYDYVHVEAQLLTLNLIDGYRLAKACYEPKESATTGNFFRFLYLDEHPNLRFPPKSAMRRSRQLDWEAYARIPQMPMAV